MVRPKFTRVFAAMHIRKAIVLMAAAALICSSIAACGSSGTSASDSTDNVSTAESSTVPQAGPAEAVEQSDSSAQEPEEEDAQEPEEEDAQEPAKEAVEVPDFTGRYAATAALEAIDLGLSPIFKSDSGKAVINTLNWKVIDQDPFPGETVDAGSLLVLKVTKDDEGGDTSGAEYPVVVAPVVVGLDASEAEKRLEDAGLKVNIESDNGKMVLRKKNWTVISQTPEGGTEMAAGGEVKLVVTKND